MSDSAPDHWNPKILIALTTRAQEVDSMEVMKLDIFGYYQISFNLIEFLLFMDLHYSRIFYFLCGSCRNIYVSSFAFFNDFSKITKSGFLL